MTGRVGPAGQTGALLPALALVLAGAGALWLSSAPLDPAHRRTAHDGLGRQRLLDARRALLAHVSAYPESYGPAGAGPGHLPCPDTDTPLDAATGAASPSATATFSGDGPNPPCGDGALAVGRLPRHVSLPSRRELIHRERGQRFVYAVSTRFVNNPTNRVVNPGGDGGGPGERRARDEVVAIIVDAGGAPLPSFGSNAPALDGDDPRALLRRVRADVARRAGRRAAARVGHVLVRREELLVAAARRVGAWFVETATAAARERCRAVPDGADVRCPRGADRAAGRHRWPALEPDCGTVVGERLLAWLADEAATVLAAAIDPAATSASGPTPDSAPTLASAFGSGSAPVPAAASACADAPPSLPATIEGTPRERHWFVRNGWHRFVTLRIDDACRDASARCTLAGVGTDDAIGPSLRLRPGVPETPR